MKMNDVEPMAAGIARASSQIQSLLRFTTIFQEDESWIDASSDGECWSSY
jgi:hypothetical protein